VISFNASIATFSSHEVSVETKRNFCCNRAFTGGHVRDHKHWLPQQPTCGRKWTYSH